MSVANVEIHSVSNVDQNPTDHAIANKLNSGGIRTQLKVKILLG
jgi:hypothetical protein